MEWSAFALERSFEGPDLFGARPVQVTLSKASKATAVVFLSARCPCSGSHEDELSELAKEFSGKGFQFLAVHSNRDEEIAEARAHFERAKLGFPMIDDSSQKLADELGAVKTPHVFVLSPGGETLYIGAVSDASIFGKAKKKYLRDALVQILTGQPVQPPKTMTLGCAIRK